LSLNYKTWRSVVQVMCPFHEQRTEAQYCQKKLGAIVKGGRWCCPQHRRYSLLLRSKRPRGVAGDADADDNYCVVRMGQIALEYSQSGGCCWADGLGETGTAVGQSTATALVGRVCALADDSDGNDKNDMATSLTNPSSATPTSPTLVYLQPRTRSEHYQRNEKSTLVCVGV